MSLICRQLVRIVATGTSIIAITSCATQQVDPGQRELALVTTPTCMSDRECELKWSAVRRWVIDNAAYKLKTVTTDYFLLFLVVKRLRIRFNNVNRIS